MSPTVRPFVAGVCLVALTTAGATATSYVPMTDDKLAQQAAVIAVVRVSAVEPAPGEDAPHTDFLVEIEQLLKGDPNGSTIVVRSLGGVRADGHLGLRIFGAPRFVEGERALLFLRPRHDGTYGIVQLMLGAFRIVGEGANQLAVRNLSEAAQVSVSNGRLHAEPGTDRFRDLARFESWLEDHARGVKRSADYFRAAPTSGSPGGSSSVTADFTLIRDNPPVRWFDFDGGGTVHWRANITGQAGLAGGGFDEFKIALQSWHNAAGSHVSYAYDGTTTASGGLKINDGTNAILFGDPNDELGGAFDCASGGTLAEGGPFYDPSFTSDFQGTPFFQIQEADVITQNGIECFFQSNPGIASSIAQQLFAHELGHTLGLGHSCGDDASGPCIHGSPQDDALMRASLHNDTRGPRQNSDDLAGIARLYGGSAIAGTPCIANTETLCLQSKRFKVQVNWHNQFNGSSGQGRVVKVVAGDASGFFSFGDPTNVELMIKLLNFGSVYKLFYGELTNLHFTITVTDTKTGEVKSYGNTPGDCGAIDQSAFPTSIPVPGNDLELDAANSRLAPQAGCHADRNTLCLLHGRFALTIDWSNPGAGTSGRGGAGVLSDVTGTFFFTDPANVEVMTKVLNFGDRIAVFFGTLSDLPYTLHVVDTATGQKNDYNNPAGKFCGGLDNHAFNP